MQSQITSTIENRYDTYRMVLEPQTLHLRDQVRNHLHHQIDEGNNRLPSYPSTTFNGETIECIDRETILEMNRVISPQERVSIMENIIDCNNAEEIRMLLLKHSPEEVIKYLKDIFIRSTDSETITNQQLLALGNIMLYSMANIPEVTILRDVLEPLRSTVMAYDRNETMNFILSLTPEFNQHAHHLRLATEEQLQERTTEFYRETNSYISSNYRRTLMMIGTTITGAGLMYVGLPYLVPLVRPIGSILVSSTSTPSLSNTITPSTNNFGCSTDIIRLRDIFDDLLKKVHECLK